MLMQITTNGQMCFRCIQRNVEVTPFSKLLSEMQLEKSGQDSTAQNKANSNIPERARNFEVCYANFNGMFCRPVKDDDDDREAAFHDIFLAC